MRVLVLGAGALGVATAHHLARAGHTVEVVDRAGPAGGTSGLGAGIFSLALPLEADRALVLASLRGLAPLLQPLERAFNRPGSHHLAGPGGQADAVAAIAAGLDGLGVPAEVWSSEEWVQALAGRGMTVDPEGVARVLSIPEDAWTLAGDLVRFLAHKAEADGVTFHRTTALRLRLREERRVRTVFGADLLDGTRITADETVVALGAWTRRFLQHHGLRFPTQAYRTHAAMLAGGVPERLPIIHDAPLSHYLRPHAPGQLLVGDGTRLDTTRPEGFDTDAEPDFVPSVKARVAKRWPTIGRLNLEGAWRGVLTGTPDRRPLVGRHPEAAGLVTAAGGNGFGIMRSWALGAVAAHAAAKTALPAGLGQEHVTWTDPARFWPEPPEHFQPREGFTLEP